MITSKALMQETYIQKVHCATETWLNWMRHIQNDKKMVQTGWTEAKNLYKCWWIVD